MHYGDEVHGEVNSADASSGVEIPIYEAGKVSARTLLATETLVITDVQVISVPGGNVAVILDADDDNALDVGETVVRGTVAANGGVAMNFGGCPRFGVAGAKPHVIAPVGVVDVVFTGYIKKA